MKLEAVREPKLTLPDGVRPGPKGYMALLDEQYEWHKQALGAAVEHRPNVSSLVEELTRLRIALHHGCNW